MAVSSISLDLEHPHTSQSRHCCQAQPFSSNRLVTFAKAKNSYYGMATTKHWDCVLIHPSQSVDVMLKDVDSRMTVWGFLCVFLFVCLFQKMFTHQFCGIFITSNRELSFEWNTNTRSEFSGAQRCCCESCGSPVLHTSELGPLAI